MIFPRKRRKRTSSTDENNLIDDLLKNTSDETESNTRRRRRPTIATSSSSDQSESEQPVIESVENEQYEPEHPELIDTQSQILNIVEVDQIRSELMEEEHSMLIEPEYWDESHNWTVDDPSHSSDYWHFLGQYE